MSPSVHSFSLNPLSSCSKYRWSLGKNIFSQLNSKIFFSVIEVGVFGAPVNFVKMSRPRHSDVGGVVEENRVRLKSPTLHL